MNLFNILKKSKNYIGVIFCFVALTISYPLICFCKCFFQGECYQETNKVVYEQFNDCYKQCIEDDEEKGKNTIIIDAQPSETIEMSEINFKNSPSKSYELEYYE